MNIRIFACIALVAAPPVVAQEAAPGIDLLFGHPIYDESANTAGITMGLSIEPTQDDGTVLTELCNELRIAAGLGDEHGHGLRLTTIFVVPYKGMAVEGYYLSGDGTQGGNALVAGEVMPRATLDSILSRAGIPSRVLDEKNVEHEVSCIPDEPSWSITWSDVRPIGDEQPETVIERARQRFLAIYRDVVEHATTASHLKAAR